MLRNFVEFASNCNYFIAFLFLVLYNDNQFTEMLQNTGRDAVILKKKKLS